MHFHFIIVLQDCDCDVIFMRKWGWKPTKSISWLWNGISGEPFGTLSCSHTFSFELKLFFDRSFPLKTLLRPVHTIRFQESDSWSRKFDTCVPTVRFQGSVFVFDLVLVLQREKHHRDIIKFVGAFHLSRWVSDKKRICYIFIRFFKITDPCVGRSFFCVHIDAILAINKNWIVWMGLHSWKYQRT